MTKLVQWDLTKAEPFYIKTYYFEAMFKWYKNIFLYLWLILNLQNELLQGSA